MTAIGAILRSLILGPERESGRGPESSGSAAPELPSNRVIYAIGDVHGRADCLHRLIQLIQADIKASAAIEPLLVLLGDYVDRGDQSNAVVELCADIASLWDHEAVFLRGNHEDAMLTFLSDPVGGAAWLRFGGLSTLMSYGVPNVAETMPEGRLKEASATLARNLPDHHRSFLESTRLTHMEGNVYFCHAGVDPGVDVGNQSPRTLMWGDGADTPGRDYPHIVVHGHVVVDEPVVRNREINVDTGAYFSGHLTCVRIADRSIAFLQT
ncbi:MAG: metallophosphoesterase [Minwuia sp.]|nr:metallophosphoesterase [Minwuia sp.]